VVRPAPAKPDLAELVEALSFLVKKEEKEPFDKLREAGA
jgi:hypothetical protein